MSSTSLKKIITVGLFTVAFVPLLTSSFFYFPSFTTKGFLFRILIEVVFGLWLILFLQNKKYRPRGSAIMLGLAILVAAAGLAGFSGEDPYRSFWSNYQRMDGLVNLIHLLAFFVIGSSVLTEKTIWEKLMKISIGVSTAVSVIGLLQVANFLSPAYDSTRLSSTLGNASFLASYLLFHIFFIIFFLVQQRPKGFKLALYTAAGLLHLAAFYHTASRGAFIGLAIGVGVAALLILFRQENKGARLWSVGILVLLFAIGGVFYLARDSS